MSEKFYTPDEVAETLRISVQTVRRWCRNGVIPITQICRQIRIPTWAVDEMLEASFKNQNIIQKDKSNE